MPNIEDLQRLLNDRKDKSKTGGRASAPFPVILDADLAVDLSRARGQEQAAQTTLDDWQAEAEKDQRVGGRRKPPIHLQTAVDEAAARVAELEAEADGLKVILVFVALPADDNDELMKQHPPREDDEDDQKYGFNLATFPIARMRECATKVVGLDDNLLDLDPKGLVAGLTAGERDLAIQVVNGINAQVASVPFFAASSPSRRRSGDKSKRR